MSQLASIHSVFTGETLHLAVESIRHCDDFPGDWRTAASGWLRSPPLTGSINVWFGIISVKVSGQVWILKSPSIPSIPCITSSLRWVQHLKRKCEYHHILDQNKHLQNERESEAFSSWPPDHLYKIYALAEYRKTHSRLPLNTRRSFYLR